MWERACSRRRCVSQYIWRLNHRLREQARSHIRSHPHSIYGVLKIAYKNRCSWSLADEIL